MSKHLEAVAQYVVMRFYSAAVQCTSERVVVGLLVKCAQMGDGTGNFSSSGSNCGAELEWGCRAQPTVPSS